MTAPVGTVIVGAGLAAAHAIQALRDKGYDHPITLVGDEDRVPYERPGLSKGYLQGKDDAASLDPHPAEWYATQDVTTRIGDRAAALDLSAREVVLSSGATVAYENLLLATGARSRRLSIPGADREDVLTLRSLGDADRLKHALVDRQRWVIIGAGWIGLEVAAAARAAGRDVTVLEYGEVPLGRVLGRELGQHFADLHRRQGVDLRTGTTTEAIEEVDGGLIVRTGQGDVAADVVVMAVGALPNVELAHAAGLAVNGGVLADSALRTSDPHVWVAGDVANAQHVTLGRLRVEHWDNAIRQGELAGTSILGGPERYDWQPYFYTDQYDLGMEYVGRGGADDDVITIRGDRSSGEFVAFWQRAGVVTAGMNVNVWDVNDKLRALVGRRVAPERLADESVTLDELAADA